MNNSMNRNNKEIVIVNNEIGKNKNNINKINDKTKDKNKNDNILLSQNEHQFLVEQQGKEKQLLHQQQVIDGNIDNSNNIEININHQEQNNQNNQLNQTILNISDIDSQDFNYYCYTQNKIKHNTFQQYSPSRSQNINKKKQFIKQQSNVFKKKISNKVQSNNQQQEIVMINQIYYKQKQNKINWNKNNHKMNSYGEEQNRFIDMNENVNLENNYDIDQFLELQYSQEEQEEQIKDKEQQKVSKVNKNQKKQSTNNNPSFNLQLRLKQYPTFTRKDIHSYNNRRSLQRNQQNYQHKHFTRPRPTQTQYINDSESQQFHLYIEPNLNLRKKVQISNNGNDNKKNLNNIVIEANQSNCDKFDRLVNKRHQKLLEEMIQRADLKTNLLMNKNNKEKSKQNQGGYLKGEFEKFLQNNFPAAKKKIEEKNQKQKQNAQKQNYGQIFVPLQYPKVEKKKLYMFTKQCQSKVQITSFLKKIVIEKKLEEIQQKRKKQLEELERKKKQKEFQQNQKRENERLQQERKRIQQLVLQKEKYEAERKRQQIQVLKKQVEAQAQQNNKENKQIKNNDQKNLTPLNKQKTTQNKQILKNQQLQLTFEPKKSLFVIQQNKQIKSTSPQLKTQKQVQKPKCLFGDSKPLFGQTKPLFGQTKPLFGQTKSLFGQTKPLFGQSKPLFGQNKPLIGSSVNQAVKQDINASKKLVEKSSPASNQKQKLTTQTVSLTPSQMPALQISTLSSTQSKTPSNKNPFLLKGTNFNPAYVFETLKSTQQNKPSQTLFKSTISSGIPPLPLSPAPSNSSRIPVPNTSTPFMSPIREKNPGLSHNNSYISNLDSSMCEQEQSNITPGNSNFYGNNNGSFLNQSISSTYNQQSQPMFGLGPNYSNIQAPNSLFNTSSSGLFNTSNPSHSLKTNQIIPSFMQNQPNALFQKADPVAVSIFTQRSPQKTQQPSLFASINPNQSFDKKSTVSKGKKPKKQERV